MRLTLSARGKHQLFRVKPFPWQQMSACEHLSAQMKSIPEALSMHILYPLSTHSNTHFIAKTKKKWLLNFARLVIQLSQASLKIWFRQSSFLFSIDSAATVLVNGTMGNEHRRADKRTTEALGHQQLLVRYAHERCISDETKHTGAAVSPTLSL